MWGALNLNQEYLQKGFAVVSAKDGYRPVFSMSEILNRNDMNDLLLINNRNSQFKGRYLLLCVHDFFLDRNVHLVEKIGIILAD